MERSSSFATLRIEGTPALSIGGADATDEPAIFHRISAVLRRTDGGLVIADGSSLQLRFFDAQGRFVRAVGREGSGPGEFQDLNSAFLLPGDSVMVSDGLQRRVAVFAPDGRHIRTVAFEPVASGGVPELVVPLANGQLLTYKPNAESIVPRPQAQYLTQSLFVAAADGRTVRSLGTFPMSEHFVQATTPDRGGIAYWSLAYGRTAKIVPFGDGFLIGDGSGLELRHHALLDGRLTRIFRSSEKQDSLTRLDRDAYSARTLQNVRADRRESLERMVREMPYPALVPSFSRVVLGGDANIWIQRYRRPLPRTDRWLVLSPQMSIVAEVEMPAGFAPMDFRPGYVSGVFTDADGVQSVRVYRLPVR